MPLEQLANLLCIYVNGNQDFPEVPIYAVQNSYSFPTENTFESLEITNILEQCAKPFTSVPQPVEPTDLFRYSYYDNYFSSMRSAEEHQNRLKQYDDQIKQYENDSKEYTCLYEIYKSEIHEICIKLTAHIESRWPCAQITMESIPLQLKDPNLELQEAVRKINHRLESWYANYELQLFVTEVQDILNHAWENQESISRPTVDFSLLKLLPTVTTILVDRSTGILDYAENLEIFFDATKAQHLKDVEKCFEQVTVKKKPSNSLIRIPKETSFKIAQTKSRKAFMKYSQVVNPQKYCTKLE